MCCYKGANQWIRINKSCQVKLLQLCYFSQQYKPKSNLQHLKGVTVKPTRYPGTKSMPILSKYCRSLNFLVMKFSRKPELALLREMMNSRPKTLANLLFFNQTLGFILILCRFRLCFCLSLNSWLLCNCSNP